VAIYRLTVSCIDQRVGLYSP